MAWQHSGRSHAGAGLALLLAAIAVLASCGDSGTASPFGPPVASDLGGSPRSLRWADFDGDGRLDLAFALGGAVWIAQGNGDGTLRRPNAVGASGSARFVAIGDLDADGRPDLVVLDCPSSQCEAAATLLTALGNGDGNFQPAVAHSSVTDALALAVGDLDGDGRADVILSHADGAVSTLPGKGDGTLGAPVRHPTLPSPTSLSASWVEVADVDGDRSPDLVFLQARSFLLGSVGYLPGRGDGTLAPAVRTDLGFSPTRHVLSDFDRDGRLDVALVGNRFHGPYPLAVLAGQADGSFGPERRIECPGPSDTYVSCTSFSVGDFDGDGIPDLVELASSGEPLASELLFLRGNGDGSFAAATGVAPPPGSGDTLGDAADLNGDGRPDLVFVGAAGVQVRLATR